MPASSAKQAYSREEVLRLLTVSERQLRSWERQNLIPPAQSFTFTDILALRTLAELRASKIPAARIRSALAALRQRLSEVRNPLAEVKIYSSGKTIQVQIGASKMEPVSGQLLLDFDAEALNNLLAFPPKQKSRKEAEHWFEKGLELEQKGAPLAEVIHAYRQAADIDPASAGALVNLGTIYFNERNLAEAERQYRRALEIDANYALAHFNLGNLFDEMGDRPHALTHYQAALRVHPSYADAHYNIALLYQATNQNMRAVQHWNAYLRLDPSSEWSAIARRELSKLRESTIVRGLGPRLT
ncbi:MAG: tetratricopeptide repeat protein [Bryobacteraceae bacterium]